MINWILDSPCNECNLSLHEWIDQMRVLLVSANTETINMPVLPMGLACVAMAIERAGHEVRILNLMTRSDSRVILDQTITGFASEVIGISVRNIDDQYMPAPKFLLEAVKELVLCVRKLSSAPIVLGGAGYSIFPKSALDYLGADMGIQGEGERAFTLLLDRLQQKENPAGLPGLVLPGSGTQKTAQFTRNLDAFPLPVPSGQLSIPGTFNGQTVWLPVQTRRGCPMNCSYCSTATIEGRIIRRRSIELAVESVLGFVQAGFRHFFFVDNTFNLPTSYAKELCDRLAARRLDIRWRCILYPWKIDEELIEKMARAGCVEVSFGFESGSRKILHSMRKRFQPEEVRLISETLGKWGISRMGFLLLGGPGETKGTVEESLSFADSLDLESMKVTTGVRIYPYTALAGIALNEGLITSDDNLLHPTFYMAKGLGFWLNESVSKWVEDRPHWHM